MTGSLPQGTVNEHTKGVAPPFDEGAGGLALGSAIVTDMDQLNYLITGLRQGVFYSVRIAATNAVGSGPADVASPKFIAPLPEPPTAPQSLDISVVDGDSVLVEWTSPARDGGEEILDYLVEWDTAALLAEVQSLEVVVPVENEVQEIETYAPFIGEVQYIAINGTTDQLVNEIQTITCDATGGVFTVTIDGYTTDAIPWDAFRLDFQGYLEALPNVGVISTFQAVAGPICAPFDMAIGLPTPVQVIFDHTDGLVGWHGDVPLMETNAQALEGHRIAEVATLVEGESPVNGGSIDLSWQDSEPVTVDYRR